MCTVYYHISYLICVPTDSLCLGDLFLSYPVECPEGRNSDLPVSERSFHLSQLGDKITADCRRVREKIDLIELGMMADIAKRIQEKGSFLQEIDWEGTDCIDQMKKRLLEDLEDQRKAEEWNIFIIKMEEILGNMEIIDFNQNQISANQREAPYPEKCADKAEDDSRPEEVWEVGVERSTLTTVKEKAALSSVEIIEGSGKEAESPILVLEEDKEEEELEAGEEHLPDMADQNCRKEILTADFPLQSVAREDESRGTKGKGEKEGSGKSCFEISGLRKLSFSSFSFSSNDLEDEVEAPVSRRKAVVNQDGIIEPESDSDTEEEEEESDQETVLEDSSKEVLFPSFSIEERLRCTIVEVVSPLELLVREERREQEFFQLYNSLQTYYCLMDQEPGTGWRPGNCCVVKTRDKGWVRALVLSVEGDDVTLHLGDIGRDITMDQKSLQPLEEQFTREPFFCFRVKLWSFLKPSGSASWTQESRQLIENHSALPAIVQVRQIFFRITIYLFYNKLTPCFADLGSTPGAWP